MPKSIFPPPVNDTEATLRVFLGVDLLGTGFAVLFRIFMLNYPDVSNPALMNVVTMGLVVIMGSVVIMIAALIQHERYTKQRKND